MANKNFVKIIKNSKGFTLVEVLVALLILTIISVSFLALFVHSYSGIFAAGQKSEVNYNVQLEMEERLTSESSNGPNYITIEFTDQLNLTIEGGIIQVDKDKNGKISSAKSFVPTIPSISIKPMELVAGYSTPLEIQVTGSHTYFTEGLTTGIIRDKDGFNIIGACSIKEIIDREHAVIEVNIDLEPNQRKEYYQVVLKTGEGEISTPLTVITADE